MVGRVKNKERHTDVCALTLSLDGSVIKVSGTSLCVLFPCHNYLHHHRGGRSHHFFFLSLLICDPIFISMMHVL